MTERRAIETSRYWAVERAVKEAEKSLGPIREVIERRRKQKAANLSTTESETRVRRPAWALLEVEIAKHIGSFAVEERGQIYRALTPTERGLLQDFATHAAYELAETIWGDAEAEIDALSLAERP